MLGSNTQLYAQKNAFSAFFIMSKKDVVVDKVLKQLTAHTGTHSIKTNHQSSYK
jgi:hypothetical protein